MADVDLTMALELRGIKEQLGTLSRQFDEVGAKGKKAGEDGQKGADKAAASFKKMGTKVLGVVGAYVSLKGAQAAFNSAQEAARTRDAVAVLEAAGGSVERLRTQTRGLFSDAALAKNANLARTLGIDSDKFAELANIAGAAAKVTGENAEFLLQSISRGTARASKLLLDNLGIMVDNNRVREEANKLMAENADLGEDAAKQQAFINQVLEQGKNITDEVAAAGANASEVFDRFTAASDNLAQAFGDSLRPAVAGVLEFLTPVANELARILRQQEELETRQVSRARELRTKVTSGKQGAKDLIERLTGKSTEAKTLDQLMVAMGSIAAGGKGAANPKLAAGEYDVLVESLSRVLGVAFEANQELQKLTGVVNATGVAKAKPRKKSGPSAKEIEKARKKAEREFEKKLKRDQRQLEFEETRAAKDELDFFEVDGGPQQIEDELKLETEIRKNNATEVAEHKRELREMEDTQVRDNNATERRLQNELAKEASEHNRQRLRELQKIQDVSQTAISISVGLLEELGQMVIAQDKKIVEKLTASALQRVGSEFVARGSLIAAEGVALAILTHGADPAAYAAIAQGGAMVGVGMGMGAAGFGITQALGSSASSNTGSDSVGSGAVSARGGGAQNVGSASAVTINVNYGVMGPHPDDTAKAVVGAFMLGQHRGYDKTTVRPR